MSKTKKIIIFIVLIIVMCNLKKVFALNAKISLVCDKTSLNPRISTTCTIKVPITSGSLTAFSGKVSLSNNLELISATSDSIWEGNGKEGFFGLYTNTPKTGTVSIGSFVVKLKTTANTTQETISLVDLVLGDENFNSQHFNTATTNIKIPSSNTNLSSLSVVGENLNFNTNTTIYNISTDKSNITINATAPSGGSVSGTGTKNLSYGNNAFNIISTSESGNTKIYVLNITRRDNRSSNNKLSGLNINSGTIFFNSNKNIYETVTITEGTFKVSATVEDNKSNLRYSPSQIINLEYGETKNIDIIVTAENGSINTYKVSAYRKDIRSTNNDLKSLNISNTGIKFSGKTSYTATVENKIDNIEIGAVANDSKSSISGIGKKTLNVGSNIFNVVVTAENGAKKTYVITIIRKNLEGKVEKLSDNNYLKSIVIEEIPNFEFNKDILDYNIGVSNKIEELNITYEKENDRSTAILEGETKLIVGANKISIVVTAEDGTTKTYTITITREELKKLVENKKEKIMKALEESEESTLTVKLNLEDKNTILDKDLLDELKISKKTIVFEVNNSVDGLLYSVNINGENVTSDIPKINIGLTFSTSNKSNIDKLINDGNLMYLNFAHEGKLPKHTKYRIYVGNKYEDGSKVYLYYYNNETKSLEKIKENLQVLNGYVETEIDHCSEYILSNNEIKIDYTSFWIVVILVLVIIIGTEIIIYLIKVKKVNFKNLFRKTSK